MDELLIIGAGPAGLSLAHDYGPGARILERSDEVGGLCRSIEFGGGVFDIGGHSFHSPHPEVLDRVEGLMRGRWFRQRRDARVFFQGGLIAYPFQNHVDQIVDPAVAAECRRGRPNPGASTSADNFEDWIVQRFGAGIARHFMLPYNRKLWGANLRRMSCDWVAQRIAGAGAEPDADAAPMRRPLMPDSEVAYPAEGGFGEIYRAFARRCGPIEFGQDVRCIDIEARTAQTAGGEVWSWRKLVSTMPLPALLGAIVDCPRDLVAAADRLEQVSLKVLLIAIGEPLTDQPQRIYIADDAAPPHKVAFNHTSSPSLRRRPVHGVMCEIAYSPEKSLAGDRELEQATLAWLVRAGLVSSSAAVIETRWVEVAYGYPVYTHERPAIVERIRAWLEPRGIHTIGRFGAWEYVNSDACIWQGMALAERLKS